MYIGSFCDLPCQIDRDSPNSSAIITGLSGTGKTVRLQQMELTSQKEGTTVIVFDLNKTHSENQIFRSIRADYMSRAQHINVVDDGLGTGLLTAMRTENGEEERFVNLVNSAVQALSSLQRMGPRQIGVLRDAVIYAIGHRSQFDSDAAALKCAFKVKDDDKTAEVVYQRLWTVLNCGALKKPVKTISDGKINIVDFSDVDSLARSSLAEISLSNLWRRICFGGADSVHQNLILAVDEFQNLSLTKNSVLLTMLREGRKFGLRLMLATQTADSFSQETLSVLNQTATHLYFRPARNEARKIAKMIAPERAQELEKRLAKLKVGEAIAVGDLNVDSRKIKRPILLK